MTHDQNEDQLRDAEAEAPENLPIAYVRTVRRDQLPNEIDAPANVQTLYALHDENGRPLAVFADRQLAMAAARTHDYAPVSVH